MVQGSTGVLRPKQNYVVAAYGSDGYTTFDLPSNKNKFTLKAHDCDYVRITKFRLRVNEICSNGKPLSVRVEYYTRSQVVSQIYIFTLCSLHFIEALFLQHTINWTLFNAFQVTKNYDFDHPYARSVYCSGKLLRHMFLYILPSNILYCKDRTFCICRNCQENQNQVDMPALCSAR